MYVLYRNSSYVHPGPGTYCTCSLIFSVCILFPTNFITCISVLSLPVPPGFHIFSCSSVCTFSYVKPGTYSTYSFDQISNISRLLLAQNPKFTFSYNLTNLCLFVVFSHLPVFVFRSSRYRNNSNSKLCIGSLWLPLLFNSVCLWFIPRSFTIVSWACSFCYVLLLHCSKRYQLGLPH